MDSSYPARCAAQDNPGHNPNFNRRWGDELAIGPDSPTDPAHGTVWHAGIDADLVTEKQRASTGWRRAEREWRAVGGCRATGLHQRSDR